MGRKARRLHQLWWRSAGTRAVEALLPVLACFDMPLVMQQVNLPFAGQSMTEGRFAPPPVQETSARALIDALAARLAGR